MVMIMLAQMVIAVQSINFSAMCKMTSLQSKCSQCETTTIFAGTMMIMIMMMMVVAMVRMMLRMMMKMVMTMMMMTKRVKVRGKVLHLADDLQC